MGWRPGELWFDADVLWFRERPRGLGALAVAVGAIDLPRFDYIGIVSGPISAYVIWTDSRNATPCAR